MPAQKSSKSRGNTRVTKKNPRRKDPLVTSPAKAAQESATLRQGLQRIESESAPGDNDARASLI